MMLKKLLISFLNIDKDRENTIIIEKKIHDLISKIDHMEKKFNSVSSYLDTTREKSFERSRGRPRKDTTCS
jgi:hypothetical protein